MAEIVEGRFDPIQIPFPINGANPTLSPQKLPVTQAVLLENILPSKAGTGTVRNGTVFLTNNQDLDDDATILRTMPFVTSTSATEELVYALEYSTDLGTDETWISAGSVSINTGGSAANYPVGKPIRIKYQTGFYEKTIYVIVTGTSIGGSDVTISFSGDELPGVSVTINEIAYGVGRIYRLNETTGAYTLLKDSLAPVCIPRFKQHMGQLVIVNGVDDNMRYDGSTVQVIYDWVLATTSARAWVSSTSFTVTLSPLDDGSAFVVGHQVRLKCSGAALAITSITRSGQVATVTTAAAHNLPTGTVVTISGASQAEYNISATITATGASTFTYTVTGSPATPATGTPVYDFTDQLLTGTIQSKSLAINVLTITTTAAFMPAASVTINTVEYAAKLPVFNFIGLAHDRLWALGAGIPSKEMNRSADTFNRVYYTQESMSVTQWYNQTTKSVPSINFQGKTTKPSQVEGIAQITGGVAFFTRDETVVYIGVDPTLSSGDFQFRWEITLPIGLVHGDLFVNLPNDVLFVSYYGAVTLSAINDAREFAANNQTGAPFDKQVARDLKDLFASDANYRRARSFLYQNGSFIGLRIGYKPLIYQVNLIGNGWVLFSGDFALATDFATDSKRRLVLAKGNKLFRYADGRIDDGTLNWADDNGNDLVFWTWITPWLKAGKQWANRYIQLMTDPGALASISVGWAINNNISNKKTIDLVTDDLQAFWDLALWDVTPWGNDYKNPYKRARFKASTMAFVLTGNTSAGPVEISELRLFGRAER